MSALLQMVLLTLAPFLELRASIPYGVFATNYSLLTVFTICVLVNIILGPIVYFFYDKIIHIFLKIKFIDRIYQKMVLKTQKKVHPYVEKYGILGLAVFIGVPLPGSGVYTGALAAYLLGFRKRDFLFATIIGVVIAGIIVMLVSTAGNGIWQFLIKKV
ncbi:ligand-binding protein SH3 [Candidatus Woesearchaeota archaeon CG_4_10_14_0_2_um_filter_33_13]|nr:MAG: ligand-binding protein SH3 [Candidatus Woesearchaeota archaeon CG_4_10_14_0_2_um_filter_33_13]